MESSYKRFAPYALAVGLAGLVFAAGAALIQRQFTVWVQASLAVGLMGLALAMLFNPSAIQTWMGGRQARYGGNVVVMALALLGILIIVNYISVRNPKRWDWSQDQLHTLAPETLAVLKQLPAPVQAVGFYSTSFATARTTAETLLDQYRVAAPGLFDYEFHDFLGQPDVVRQYDVIRDGTLVLVMGDQREELNFATEDEISGALIRMSNPTSRVIYFLTGHGERVAESTEDGGMSSVADLLKRQNYVLKELDLTITTTVPADTRAIVIAGPLVPVTQGEVDALRTYVDAGGALVVLLDPKIQTQTDLAAAEPLVDYLAGTWGLRVVNDFILDFSNSVSGQPAWPIAFGYGESPITTRLQGIGTFFPQARSLLLPPEGTSLPNLTYAGLVQAAPSAWGETNFSSQSAPTFDQTDTPPPLNLAVTVENTATKGRVVVFGDSDFASNAFADEGANAILLASSVNWVTTEETLINLTPKTSTQRTLAISNALTVNLIFLIVVILLPLAVLIFGGVVWFQRRRHV